MKVLIDIPEEEYEKCKFFADLIKGDVMIDSLGTALRIRIANGTPLPKTHGRLIDADACLEKAWQDFYRQEDEHEKNHKDYDIFRDRLYEQAGFECCQQAIASAPTIIEADKEAEK